MLEAGYFLPKKPFFENIGTILTYAVVGTVINAFGIGLTLYGAYKVGAFGDFDEDGKELTCVEFLLFGSIMSAVDPVTVISVFEDVHVHTTLYIRLVVLNSGNHMI